MRNSIIISTFVFFASVFNIHKSIGQDSALINTLNTVISKVDKNFSLDNDIDSVQIDSLNKFYFITGAYTDTTDENNKYGKFYVLKYDNHKFSIIDSTSKFMYGFNASLNFGINKDSIFIHFYMRRQTNDYTYIFNKHLQIYQLVGFSRNYIGKYYFVKNENNEDGYSLRQILNSNYDVKKQLLLWEITKEDENDNKIYKKSGKKIILSKNFPIQLRKFDMVDSSIPMPPGW